MKIGIVGTGLIGTGWAAFYASRGFAVSVFDSDEATRVSARDRTIAQIEFLNRHGLLGSHDFDRVVEHVTVAGDLGEAVADADLVQESVVERYDVKKAGLPRRGSGHEPRDDCGEQFFRAADFGVAVGDGASRSEPDRPPVQSSPLNASGGIGAGQIDAS